MGRLIKSVAVTVGIAVAKRLWRAYRQRRGTEPTGPRTDGT
ncbi:hypothetical protein [Glycomyces tenuis]|nr:hypothetical protein [Glycomyces tenuis]